MKKKSQILIFPLALLLLTSGCTSDKKETGPAEQEHAHAHDAEEGGHAEESGKSTEAGHEEEGGHEEESENQVVLTADQEKLAEIKTASVEQRVLGNVLRVNGVIDVPPGNLVSVSTPYGGTVKSTNLLQGAKVEKGQVLAVLQNPEFLQIQQDYLQAQAQLEYLKAEYERKQLLYKEEVASQKSFQAAKAEYQAQAVRVNALAEQLKLIGFSPSQLRTGNISSTVSIRSSINGFVKSINANVGKFVEPMAVMFELVDPRQQLIALTVFQQNADQVKQGQRVLYSLPGESKMDRKATVSMIGKAIGEENSIQVHAIPENRNDPALRPGAYVQALLETGSKQVGSIPEQAVVEFEEKNYVFVQQPAAQGKTGKVYQMIEVNTGLTEGGFIEVRTPAGVSLDSTAQIVVEGAYALLGKLKNKEEEGGHAH